MELEEMQTLWGEMSVAVEKQKKLTDSLILKMIRADFKNKLNKILIPEAISTVVAFAAVIYILFNLQKLTTWYLLACGIITVIILIVLPILSIRTIYKMKSVNISGNDLKQSLQQYSKQKLRWVSVQKISFYLGAVLMIATLPAMSQIMSGVDVFTKTKLWLGYAIAFPFYYAFAKWVLKYYTKTTVAAEAILKELED
jgi:hypothetical protein